MKRFVSENDQSAAGAEVGNPESETSKKKGLPRNSSSSSTTCPTMSSLPQLAALWFLQQWPPRSRIGIPSTMRRMPSRSPPSSQRPGRPRTRSPGRRQTATTAALRSLGGTLCSIARSELPRGVILVERLGKISFLAFWCPVAPPLPPPPPPATLRPRRAKKGHQGIPAAPRQNVSPLPRIGIQNTMRPMRSRSRPGCQRPGRPRTQQRVTLEEDVDHGGW